MGLEQADKPFKVNFEYFERRLASHQKVRSFTKLANQVYRVNRTDDTSVTVYLTNLYTVGQTDYYDIRTKCPTVSAIVTISSWNGYSKAAKQQANEDKIGLFTGEEFMGALRVRDVWAYATDDDRRKSV